MGLAACGIFPVIPGYKLILQTLLLTVVTGVSVRLLDLIAHRNNLQILCSDTGNAFITAKCLEKVYSRATRPEFREREGSVIIIRKVLYSLHLSS
jgi:phosphomannomutase